MVRFRPARPFICSTETERLLYSCWVPTLSKLPGGIVTYTSPILLKGAHDKVVIDLVDKSPLGSMEDDLDELKQSGVDAKLKMESS